MNSILRFLLLIMILIPRISNAQDAVSNTVLWEFHGSTASDGKLTVIFKGRIQSGWKLFSTSMPDSLPNTRVILDSNSGFRISAIAEKGSPVEAKEPLFDNASVKYFEKEIELVITLLEGMKVFHQFYGH